MACPRPQPGHQAMPNSFKGHKVKWAGPFGSVNANEISAAIQKNSSKYFKNNPLINLVTFVGLQYRYR